MNACGTVLLTIVLLAVIDMRKFIPPTLPVTEVPSHVYLASLPIFVACRKKHQHCPCCQMYSKYTSVISLLFFPLIFCFFYKNLILCDID